jgi:predicted metal-binding protein
MVRPAKSISRMGILMFDELTNKALELGATEARLIATPEIVFDPRSFLKCRFGCNRWGRFWTCPPHLALSPDEFMKAFAHYSQALIVKTQDPKTGQKVALALEKEAMLSHGAQFAFAMILCVLCDECAYPEPCRFPHLARPSMDAYGIDIGKTLEPLGFKVEFDQEGKLLPAWFGMVLLD